MVMGFKRAFLYGDMPRDVYVEIPSDDDRARPWLVGKLQKAMYGTQDAPAVWQAVVQKMMGGCLIFGQ